MNPVDGFAYYIFAFSSFRLKKKHNLPVILADMFNLSIKVIDLVEYYKSNVMSVKMVVFESDLTTIYVFCSVVDNTRICCPKPRNSSYIKM